MLFPGEAQMCQAADRPSAPISLEKWQVGIGYLDDMHVSRGVRRKASMFNDI